MRLFFLLITTCLSSSLWSQYHEAAFQQVYRHITSHEVHSLITHSETYTTADSINLIQLNKALNLLNDYIIAEFPLKGKAGFNVSGNESDVSSLFKVGVNGEIKKPGYPNQLDFKANIQTIIQNGVFRENVSNIDVSFDFHPHVPDENDSDDGLWLENYVFVKRFSNNFLGIAQRYESGFGFVFNYYSKDNLTINGQRYKAELDKLPFRRTSDKGMKEQLVDIFSNPDGFVIDEDDAEVIAEVAVRQERYNVKRFSRLKLGMLIGMYYELEQVSTSDNVNFNGVDTTIFIDFEASHKLRWEFRPTIVWQPNERYRFKLHPYLKLPIGPMYTTVVSNDKTSKMLDAFFDLQSSFSIMIERHFFISLNYNLIYDFAPRRRFITQDNGSVVLLQGAHRFHNFNLAFNFKF